MTRILKFSSVLLMTTALALPVAGCVDDMDNIQGAEHAGHGSHGAAAVSTPLLDTLGTHEHKITTSSGEAQAYFNQGYRQLINFNHAASIAAFQEALKRDPKCAMCWWGIAFAYGPNINMPMMPDAVAPAMEAIANAQKLASGASASERDYIGALSKQLIERDQVILRGNGSEVSEATGRDSDGVDSAQMVRGCAEVDDVANASQAVSCPQPGDHFVRGC